MSDKSTVPEQGTAQWRKNESIIANDPVLRAARDQQQGFKPSSGITSAPSEQYKSNYDRIDWSKRKDD